MTDLDFSYYYGKIQCFLTENHDVVSVEQYNHYYDYSEPTIDMAGAQLYPTYDLHGVHKLKFALELEDSTVNKIEDTIKAHLMKDMKVEKEPEPAEDGYIDYKLTLNDEEKTVLEGGYNPDHGFTIEDAIDAELDRFIDYEIIINDRAVDLVFYAFENNIDISDSLIYQELKSQTDYNTVGALFVENKDIQTSLGKDLSELSKEEKDQYLSDYKEDAQYILNDEVFQYDVYNQEGKYQYSGSILGEDLPAIEEDVGELIEDLGNYDTITDCFEANAEKIGVVVETEKSLEERISVAEERAAKQGNSDKAEKSKEELEM